MIDQEAKREKIKVTVYTTTNHRIEGEVVIQEGYRGRLSDVLNDGRMFLAISNAQLFDKDGQLLSQNRFLSLNKTTASIILPTD